MQRTITRTLASGLTLAVAGAFLAAGPTTGTASAAATPTSQAYGLAASITLPLLQSITVAPAAPSAYPGGPASANTVPLLDPLLGGILSTGVVTSGSNGDAADGTSDSTTGVAGLNLLNILKADAVRSTCTADGGGVTGATNLTGLKAGGNPTGADVPAPNTSIAIAGIGTVVLNEQTPTSTAGRTAMSVNALHITLNALNVASGDIVVGHSQCAADAKAPTVTGVTPGSGPSAGGTQVTVTGTGFTQATGVKFGITPATSFEVTDGRHITAVAPAGTAGTVDVSVTNRTGTSANTGAVDYTYTAAPPPTPTVSSVSPGTGPGAGGTQVVIRGTGLGAVTDVTFGGTPATAVHVDSSTRVTATSPAGSGLVDVRVTSAGGTSANTLADNYLYLALPTIGTALPISGPEAGGTTVTIAGTGLNGATAVKFGGVDAASFTVDSPLSITAVTPPGTGTVPITVTSPGGTSALVGLGFTYTPASTPTPSTTPSTTPPSTPSATPSSTPTDSRTPTPTPTETPTTPAKAPVLGGISPARGPIGGGQVVRITGSGLGGATGASFGGAAGTQVTAVSDSLITVRTPAHARGAVPVTVTGPGGTSDALTYTYLSASDAPAVTTVAPAYGSVAGGTRVTISGSGFDATSTVTFGGVAGRDPALGSADGGVSETLTVTTPAHASGPVTVKVDNGGGDVEVPDGFTYVPPMIGSVDFGLRVVAGSTISVAPRGSSSSQLRVAACSGSRGTTSVTTTGGACVYTAPPSGTDVFTMTVVDVLGQTATQRVRVRVVPTAADLVTNGGNGRAGATGAAGTNASNGAIAAAATGPDAARAEDDTAGSLSTDGDRLTAGSTGDNLLSFLPLLLGMMTGFVVIGLYARRRHHHPAGGGPQPT